MRQAIATLLFILLFTSGFSQKTKKPYLGKMSTNVFYNKGDLKSWFLPEYNQYALQEVLVEELRPMVQKKQFVVVMGTWCDDSHYEFPRLIKLMEALGIGKKQLQIFAVNKEKTEPAETIAAYKVTKVPVLLMKDAEATEWNVVGEEKPQISWEVDLRSALLKKP